MEAKGLASPPSTHDAQERKTVYKGPYSIISHWFVSDGVLAKVAFCQGNTDCLQGAACGGGDLSGEHVGAHQTERMTVYGVIAGDPDVWVVALAAERPVAPQAGEVAGHAGVVAPDAQMVPAP